MNEAVDPSNFLNDLLIKAIESKASDVHIEPESDSLNVRMRVDGLMRLTDTINKFSQDQIISRVKILAQMDITIQRLPQNGHFKFQHNGRVYSIRVSTLPSSFGENVVFRLHNREDALVQIEDMAFDPVQREQINKILANPYGMIILTGPTGSGKTTFLYSLINNLNKPEKNIITLEDPVEYQLANIRQTDVNDASGMTYAIGLRAVLRQDPDIVMIGEIRDSETAQLAIQASLTGTLVLTTFQTFDMPALMNRLVEMGFSHAAIAQCINGVISTRLLRKICQSCQTTPYFPTELEKKIYSEEDLQGSYVKGKGCPSCHNSGYAGRTNIFEIVRLDDEIKSLILDHRSAREMQELLTKKQIRTLRESALDRARKGITTLEEVTRVLGASGEKGKAKN